MLKGGRRYRRKRNPASKSAAAKHPITIPAIAPPERDEPLWSEVVESGSVVLVLVGKEVDMEEVNVDEVDVEEVTVEGVDVDGTTVS